MRNLLLASMLAGCSAFGAHAADMDGTGYDWSGIYVGVNGGIGALTETTTDYQGFINGYTGGDFSQTEMGGFLGGTVGVNQQIGSAVFGVEADLQWANMESHRDLSGGLYENGGAWDWYATLRARAGLAHENTMAYVTAGVAAVSVDYDYGQLATPVPPGYHLDVSGTEYGLAAGAGVEHAFTDKVSLKLEYLYIGLPTNNQTGIYADDYDFVSSAHLARLGLNYRF